MKNKNTLGLETNKTCVTSLKFCPTINDCLSKSTLS